MRRMTACRGQTTVEYAVFCVALIAALLGMAVYIRRGIAGKLRDTANSIGEQYGPGETTSNLTTTVTGTTTTTSLLKVDQDLNGDGTPDADVMVTTSTIDTPETSNRTGTENVGPM